MTLMNRRTDEAAADPSTAALRAIVPATGRSWRDRLTPLIPLVVLIALVLVITIKQPNFLSLYSMRGLLESVAPLLLLALGQMFVILTGGIDLAFAAVASFGTVLLALWIPDMGPGGIVLALLVTSLIGYVNGFVVAKAQVPSFIVTLASGMLFRGAALAFADGKQIAGLPANNSFFNVFGGDIAGVPTGVWAMLVVVVVLTIVFTRTRFGAQVRAIGSNPDAAVFSGLPIARTRALALGVSGIMAGAAAALALAFFIAGDPTIGNGYELTAIAACIIGGTPLMGGKGSVPGALLGSLILAVVASSLVFFHVPINWTTFATGAVILIAVALDAQLRRTQGRGLWPRRRTRPIEESASTTSEEP